MDDATEPLHSHAPAEPHTPLDDTALSKDESTRSARPLNERIAAGLVVGRDRAASQEMRTSENFIFSPRLDSCPPSLQPGSRTESDAGCGRTINTVFTSPNRLSDIELKNRALAIRKWGHLLVSLVLLVGAAITMELSEHPVVYYKPRQKVTTVELIIVSGLTAAQVAVMAWSLAFKIRNKNEFRLQDVWVHYLAQLLNFAGIYLFFFLIQRNNWWKVPPLHEKENLDDLPVNSAWEWAFLFVYFSSQTQTLVGYGDVLPISTIPSLVCSLQVLLGLLHVSLFIAGTASKLMVDCNSQGVQLFSQSPLSSATVSLPWKKRLRKGCRRWLLPCIMCLFVVQLGVLYGVNNCILQWEKPEASSIMLACVSLCFNLVALGVICVVSFKYIRQPDKHQVSLLFIVQVYLSACLIFTAIFVTTMAFDSRSWRFSFSENQIRDQKYKFRLCEKDWSNSDKRDTFFTVVFELLFFSISTMTTAGQAGTFPMTTLTRFCCLTQQLSSVFFSSVILACGMSRLF